MTTRLLLIPSLLLSGAAISSSPVQMAVAGATSAELQSARDTVDASIAEWRELKDERNPTFSRAAQFAIAHPDWPNIGSIRARAEEALNAFAPDPLVLEFFDGTPPRNGRGWTALALAQERQGRTNAATEAARNAWLSDDLSDEDIATIRSRFGSRLTALDHDRRIDALLFVREREKAEDILSLASPGERQVAEARLALQRRDSNADVLFARVADRIDDHAGLLMDRARYFRASGQESASESLLARDHDFTTRPTNVDKWYEMLLLAAEGASDRGAHVTAYNIARQLDDALPDGAVLANQAYGVRDKYTSLAWLAGTTARERLGDAAAASRLFESYSTGGRSLQVRSKGLYWAGRSAQEAGNVQRANALYASAAETPELFYSQLALERLGRDIPVPPALPEQTAAARNAFASKPIVVALSRLGDPDDRAVFVRAIATSLETEQERLIASDYALRAGRADLGVWIARAARNDGTAFYYRSAWPVHPRGAPGGDPWSIAHGITRQESSFDNFAVSHANAHGMMQLLPATAREQARRMGLEYCYSCLRTDPAYNVRLGSGYFAWLSDYYDGNKVLAAAAYNGGMGNVNRWIRNNGDPRTSRVDTVEWIEKIPFMETRGYVQRVLENAAVYDRLNPYVPAYGAVHVSRHLGKTNRPG
ncbi:lytic transglycosylase domain-containing protein [Sphingomicrobium sediminis]|uniref:Lytic transglycosylase domain-containing protein n=1 Tax=Sphingomicrobium sediminis TaxID=2950949 RepID=A0A9X2EKC1_9SPHN|nr:lytic transglycosylase domain-containing protein [Sphingomicrobium sediminis]MCM8556949.1 lytic transglycosylase domain-containing protein [Sphingomicrobium sediminis]